MSLNNVDTDKLQQAAESFKKEFSNATAIFEKFALDEALDKIGSQPATGHLHLFFIERALGMNPDYTQLKSVIEDNQYDKKIAVTVKDPAFKQEILTICDTHIAQLKRN